MPVTVERRASLIYVSLSGSVGIHDLEVAARLLERMDREPPGLHRLVDTSQVTHVELDFTVLLRFTNRRNHRRRARDVRVAIFVRTDEAYGFARMFQDLQDDAAVVVEVFLDRPEAVAWLGGTGSVLLSAAP